MASLLVNSISRLFPLAGGFHLRRDGTDFDLLKLTGEIRIEAERVGRVNVATWWMFLQDLKLGTSQRLQVTFEIDVIY